MRKLVIASALAAATLLPLHGVVAETAVPAAPAPAASVITLPSATPEEEGFDSTQLAKVNAAMHAYVDSGKLAGIQTMVVRHGHVVQFDNYGKGTATGPMAPDLIFRMYSQTKPTIAVAMMILYEQCKWTLDDPVSKFIPAFANLQVVSDPDSKEPSKLVAMKHVPNMRELMTHSAGFGYGLASDNYVDLQFQQKSVLRSNGLQEMVDKIATIPLRYQPGTRWSYSSAVDIQGYIIEKLSGMRLADFMKKNIYDPLKMTDSGFYVPAERVSQLASVYFSTPTGSLIEITPAMSDRLQDFTKVPAMDSGGGGSVGSANDYARFCQMILNKGELEGARILQPASVDLLTSNIIESSVAPHASKRDPFPIGGDTIGFAMNMGLMKNAGKAATGAANGSVWWGGAAGTWFWIDPKNDLFFLGNIQHFGGDMTGSDRISIMSQMLVYPALTHPEK
ncbi:MAG TPA: serine hydrolase domain-containing protein, partial [Rhizomicrobium sp.]|jgi:CubicO group peptidase (beta-lactamase class C family)|nr:serine hydrolase domain-containing protein [Rhizomicrobium sp.]